MYNNLYNYLIEDLLNVFKDNAYLSITIDNRIKKANFSTQDKKIYTKIIYGVVENKILLDYYLQPFVKGIRVKPIPRQALRIGAYVIDKMNIQNHFIVNEIVNVIKKIDYHSYNFVNAVLRNYESNEKPTLNNLSLLEKESIKLSIPKDILNLLYNQYHEECFNFYKESNVINSYRINILKETKENVLKTLDNDNIEYNIEQDSLCLKTKTSLINHELFKQGIIQAQDSSSMKVCEVVNPLPNSTVLDVCSAPGGKSMYMACLMNNQGYIMSCDKYEEKIKKIKQNAINQGINIIDARVLDGTNADYNKQFDNVLVDAPCSGLGTINHKPDLKYRISLNDINDIVSLQEKILLNASRYVKLNGYLTYSTCTINQQENEEQTNKFLNTHKDFEKTEEILILPSNTNDGFYICKMKKVR